MKEITLYGAGGHCYAAIELIRSLNEYKPSAILDDAPNGDSIMNLEVNLYTGQEFQNLCITIGDNAVRRKIAKRFSVQYPTFIHSSAVVYPSSSIGKGTLIHPNAVIDADVKIGDFCIINNNASLSHNVTVSDFAHIAIQAAVAGGVKIGEGTLIGAGSIILPEITIGKWATIGAGAVVTKNVPDYAMVYGNPAKIINYNNELHEI